LEKENFNDELNNEVRLNNNYRISDYFFFRLSSKYDTILQNFKEIRISAIPENHNFGIVADVKKHINMIVI